MLKDRRTYPPEFKREAVELMKNSEKPIKEIAEDLGIRTEILHRWKREQLLAGDHSFPGHGNLSDPEEASRRDLEKRLRDAEEERDILKKALAIFSKQTR